MKVALVHDWLTGMRGGERCLEAFLRIYPQADVFSLIHVAGSTSDLIDDRLRATSFLQKLPAVKNYYRLLLPLFPKATESLDLSGYDLVLSLSHSAAKNVNVPENSVHICYCFTPMRYIWDQARSYFGALTPLLWPMISSLRKWDVNGARRPDHFVAISRFVAARIRCFYEREAEVIYPPVDSSWINPAKIGTPGEAFLYAGALVPYKKPELVIEAFNKMDQPLWVVGKGPMQKRLKRMAGPRIKFFGHVPDAELAELYARSRALIFPGTEDFGMVPIECLAAGRPVIGLYDGALKETLPGITHWKDRVSSNTIGSQCDSYQSSFIDTKSACGVFIERAHNASRKDQVQALIKSVQYFIERENDFQVESCVRRAEHFSPMRFYRAWNSLLGRLGLLPGFSSNALAANS